MNECLEQLNDWIDPEKKFKFISINNFAHYLGIKQTAVMDLVDSKRISKIESFEDILHAGSKQDVLNFLKTENLFSSKK